jgi:hypothetical protein
LPIITNGLSGSRRHAAWEVLRCSSSEASTSTLRAVNWTSRSNRQSKKGVRTENDNSQPCEIPLAQTNPRKLRHASRCCERRIGTSTTTGMGPTVVNVPATAPAILILSRGRSRMGWGRHSDSDVWRLFPKPAVNDSRMVWGRLNRCWRHCGRAARDFRTSGGVTIVITRWPTLGLRPFRCFSCRAHRFWHISERCNEDKVGRIARPCLGCQLSRAIITSARCWMPLRRSISMRCLSGWLQRLRAEAACKCSRGWATTR